MDKAKIQTVVKWPEPQKVKDVQAFLGFANFYQWFIFGYSEIRVPLSQLTQKHQPWEFTAAC
jgi:hypothetical protein